MPSTCGLSRCFSAEFKNRVCLARSDIEEGGQEQEIDANWRACDSCLPVTQVKLVGPICHPSKADEGHHDVRARASILGPMGTRNGYAERERDDPQEEGRRGKEMEQHHAVHEENDSEYPKPYRRSCLGGCALFRCHLKEFPASPDCSASRCCSQRQEDCPNRLVCCGHREAQQLIDGR